ncbi:related to actin cytoskeleton protein (VIP1) [Cephalotrichum gorgonifer]|uniref:Related to actin cytoskeleton protein (VIP1) n=1 Tax=Cephalotrichum gorgonifer TaxID=2041049 RepID=A0AAE8N2Y6_9PEZI|nr:related to actin cytoskeleton protein (VIP1) [Cephalotrichum gorgonifer]
MTAANTVEVKNIAAATADSEIKDFFSFCGKVSDFQVAPAAGETKSATVTFEKETALKTALLLNNTQLGGSTITVTSLVPEAADRDGSPAGHGEHPDEITQEMKPRARILAEYLASGYVIGDAALEGAIELDKRHGVTDKFLSTLQNLDAKYHATERAKATDESYGITSRGMNLLGGLGSYFEKAASHPTGKKIVNFYTDGSRQVQDIHAEAVRLAELKKEAHGGSARKASGLERVFGGGAPKEGAAASEKPASGSAEKPAGGA